MEGAAKLGAQYADAKQYGSKGKKGNGNKQSQHPCHALCKRLLRHQEQLFQFGLLPGLSSYPRQGYPRQGYPRTTTWLNAQSELCSGFPTPPGRAAQGIGWQPIPQEECHPHDASFPVWHMAGQGSQPL